MGLSVTYHLAARGQPEEIRQRIGEWLTQLKTLLPECGSSDLCASDEAVSFHLMPGPGSEIARMRLRRGNDNLWTGFWDCKTQFAGCLQHGGEPNFLKSHGRLITALDMGRSLGLVESVSDDGGYWTHRSAEILLKQFRIYQEVVGSLVAQVRQAGFSVESPVERKPEVLPTAMHS